MNDELRIDRAAVIGAGVMGAAIAAHLANCGIPSLLLDLKSRPPEDEETRPGDPLAIRKFSNRLATRGLEGVLKSRPAAFYVPSLSGMIEVGNLEDDLEKLGEVDWVIEAVIEDLAVKRDLFGKIAPHLKPGVVLSTNTSGLPVASLAETLPPDLRKRFLVTHFFNPPRYLRLLEIVPCADTDPDLLRNLAEFGERRLGKGIVFAKDTPNFIANRIGVFSIFHALHLMVASGMTVAEVDRLSGKAIGRPKSANFRTADLVGLDTLAHVAQTMRGSVADPVLRDLFEPPEFVRRMIKDGWLGEKSGQGFYKKKRVAGKREIEMIDPETLEYVPTGKVSFPSLEMARNIEETGERIRVLLSGGDRAGEFLWKNLSSTLLFAASSIPDASDDIVNIDRAMCWGFGWELGPFETWEALGVEATATRMSKDGLSIPDPVQKLLGSSEPSFYSTTDAGSLYFDFGSGEHRDLPVDPRLLVLSDLKRSGRVIRESPDATLIDLGDDVACLEFHTKMNTIGPGVIEQLEKSLDLVEEEWRGLVIANDAENFSVGANLLLVLNEIDDDNFDEVDWMVRRFQQVNQRLRFSRRPVVVAPHGLTLGGACEITLGADRVCAAAETYIGLVEVGAGVIPAGGGCKELVKRIHERVPDAAPASDLFPHVRRLFETVGMGTVATSGPHAKEIGYLRRNDHVCINRAHLIHDAKSAVLAIDQAGYRPSHPLESIRVVGEPGLAAIRVGLYNFAAGGHITEYDRVVGEKLAWVLCGGEVSGGSRVSESYLLDLEREAFLSLCGDSRTLARMEHILTTGKPLRN